MVKTSPSTCPPPLFTAHSLGPHPPLSVSPSSAYQYLRSFTIFRPPSLFFFSSQTLSSIAALPTLETTALFVSPPQSVLLFLPIFLGVGGFSMDANLSASPVSFAHNRFFYFLRTTSSPDRRTGFLSTSFNCRKQAALLRFSSLSLNCPDSYLNPLFTPPLPQKSFFLCLRAVKNLPPPLLHSPRCARGLS